MQVPKDSAEWLRVTLSSIGDAVITTDPHGRVTFLNPVAAALTGWTQQEAVGVSLEQVFRIVNEDTRAPVENPALRALREGVPIRLANPTLLISRDGTERPIGPIEKNAAPVLDDKGNVGGVVLVFRDVTERRRQEKLVQDTLEHAENILATQRGPFLVLDRDLRVVSANRAFYKTFGVAKEATQGRFICDLGDGQWNIPKLRQLLEEVLPQNNAFDDFEVEHDFARIGRKVMVLNARRVQKPGNDSELILLAIDDITTHRAAEQDLRDSEVRYRRLFQTAKDGILILDAHTGKIIDANAFMSALVGVDPGDLLGKELYEIGMFKDVEENKEAFRELQRTGYLRQEHLPIRNQRGERVEVEFIANVYQEDHRLVAQCNVRDISERVAMEKQIKEQTAELAEQSRRKDEFLAMLSHELRNPLAPILSATHLLRLEERGSENPIAQQAREVIERQVGHLTSLVSDLLEISRVISGRIRLVLETLDMSQVVRDALEQAGPPIEQQRHDVSLTLPTEPVWVNADTTRLEQVVVNLISNAAKYTDEGGRIGVSLEREENQALLRVRDSGIGIAPELLPRIFDLFTQAERSLDRSQGGLGIGLSLVQRLVEMQGGTVEAHSDGPGKGSEFMVRLPLTAVIAPQNPQPSQTPAKHDQPTAQGLRVLVVEDNLDGCAMLARLLQHRKYVVQVAHTGPAGLEAVLNWRPDVVLLDIGLPGMDGYEVARRIRAGSASKNTKLMALTGYGTERDVQLTREAGFDAHVVKPDVAEVQKLLAAWSKLDFGHRRSV